MQKSILPKEEVEKNLAEGVPFVIRQKMPLEGSTGYDDVVYGHIEIEINGQLSIENAFNDSDEEIKAFEMVKVIKGFDICGLFVSCFSTGADGENTRYITCPECFAEALYNAGYGDVSEYKAEIERLRQEVRDTDKMARNTIEQEKSIQMAQD